MGDHLTEKAGRAETSGKLVERNGVTGAVRQGAFSSGIEGRFEMDMSRKGSSGYRPDLSYPTGVPSPSPP